MSYSGMSPKVNRLRLQPRSADPDLPTEGDLQYADGTVRAEGLYVYKNSAWVSVVDSQGQVDKLRFVPQSADPVSPQTGDVFYADGSSRAAGLWLYQNSTWVFLSGNTYQDIAYKQIFNVRLAGVTSVNYTLSALIPGFSFDNVTLVAGDFILLKSQAPSTDNGVYVVATSGAPSRHADFDTAAKLTYAAIAVQAGSTNINKSFVQSNSLSTLSDAQSWSEVTAAGQAPAISFTVPQGLTSINVIGSGGGAGGGGGGNIDQYDTGSNTGGAGGGAGVPLSTKLAVTAGETLTIQVGAGGRGGAAGYLNNGFAGGDTLVYRGSDVILRIPGATNGGLCGYDSSSAAVGPAGTSAVSGAYAPLYLIGSLSGNGGYGRAGNSGIGDTGGSTTSVYASAVGGTGGKNGSGTGSGIGGGGGAGGCGFTAGARGGHGGSRSQLVPTSVVRSANITTVTLSGASLIVYQASPFVAGDRITIFGATPSSFNGTWTVLTASSTSFTVYNPGPDATASSVGLISQSTPGHNGTYGSGGGGGGGRSGTYAGVYDLGRNGGWGGLGFVRFIW